jgi:hypothetical protein
MNEEDRVAVKLEVYKNIYEMWRFEVDSYWQRNNYFSAFEIAALGGCWYVLEKSDFVAGLTFSVLGACLTGFWLRNNIVIRRLVDYWRNSAQSSEKALSLEQMKPELDFACKHPISRSWNRVVPVIFGLAWLFLITYALCHLCTRGAK